MDTDMIDKDCIFCKIVRGDIPCAKIYETPAVLAFLDIAPIRPGHALVIPKAHHRDVWELPDEDGRDLLAAIKIVGRAVVQATGAGGLNVGMNNGPPAGQLVPHAHFHLIPRVSGDGLEPWPGTPYADAQAMSQMAWAIRSRI